MGRQAKVSFQSLIKKVFKLSKKDKLDIIYEDKELIVINKPAGILTVSTDK